MLGVQRMLDDRLGRHREEWNRFKEVQATARRELEASVAACAEGAPWHALSREQGGGARWPASDGSGSALPWARRTRPRHWDGWAAGCSRPGALCRLPVTCVPWRALRPLAGAAHAEMREKLAADDEDVEALMSVLSEDQVMTLTEAEVVEVSGVRVGRGEVDPNGGHAEGPRPHLHRAKGSREFCFVSGSVRGIALVCAPWCRAAGVGLPSSPFPLAPLPLRRCGTPWRTASPSARAGSRSWRRRWRNARRPGVRAWRQRWSKW